MNLTTAQKIALKNAIAADLILAAFPNTSDGNFDLANSATGLRALASPTFTVWKTSVSIDDVTRADNFDWTRVDNLSVGLARCWEWMFDGTNTINPSKANVRAGIDNVWKGTAADLNVRAVVYGVCKRAANKMEQIFATGTGSDASPATMGVDADGRTLEGTLTPQDIADARNS